MGLKLVPLLQHLFEFLHGEARAVGVLQVHHHLVRSQSLHRRKTHTASVTFLTGTLTSASLALQQLHSCTSFSFLGRFSISYVK